MKFTKRLTPFVLTFALLIAPVSALAKPGKPAKVIRPSVAASPVKPQGSCDQTCYQEFFDAIDTCNGINYLDPSEVLYSECIQMAQRNLGLCQIFCRIGGILGKAQPKNIAGIRGLHLSE